jgi:single-stranded-DNA-specific exonuclease
VTQAATASWLASLAKIAALSTIADVVPLTGENRVLVAWGLAGLAEPRAPGLAALMRRAGVPAGRGPTAREVAFRVAPRLNALGRLDHARRALELLTTTDAARAETLADELEAANVERRAVQDRLVAAVLGRIGGSFDPDRDAVVVEAGDAADGWHRGVLGIAASKVAERVRRPVLLFARDGERISGSGRTWGRTPLFDRVAPVAGRFATEFGGHDAALGLTLPAADWEVFRGELRAAFAKSRDDAEWDCERLADAELAAADVDTELVRWVERFEPDGPGNPRPLFLFRGLSWDGRGKRIGKSGLRTAFGDGRARIDAIGWTLGGIRPEERPARVDVAAHVTLDAYTGRPTLDVLEMEPAAP